MKDLTLKARDPQGTVALKWMPTTHVALMLNYVHTAFDTPIVANGVSLRETDAVTLRGQFDFF